MQVLQVRSGLYRWTGQHPAWTPETDWPQEVGSVYYEGPDRIVLFDPIVPPEAPDEFWQTIGDDIELVGLAVHVLLTCDSHRRSTDEIAERLGATVGGDPPAGVEAYRVEPYAETIYWLPEHGAVVVGDVLFGSPLRKPPMQRVPEEYRGDRYAEPVRFLLDLPVDSVLVAHGDPVLDNGRAAIREALSP